MKLQKSAKYNKFGTTKWLLQIVTIWLSVMALGGCVSTPLVASGPITLSTTPNEVRMVRPIISTADGNANVLVAELQSKSPNNLRKLIDETNPELAELQKHALYFRDGRIVRMKAIFYLRDGPIIEAEGVLGGCFEIGFDCVIAFDMPIRDRPVLIRRVQILTSEPITIERIVWWSGGWGG